MTIYKELHKCYYGALDKSIEEFLKNPKRIEIDESRQSIITSSESNNINMWPDGKENGKRFAIKSIRVINYDNIDPNTIFKFEVGNMRFAYTKSNSNGDLNFHFTSYDNMFPGLKHHNISVYSKIHDVHFKIEYTLVPIKDINDSFENIYINNFFEYYNSSSSTIDLDIHYPVTEINIYTEKNMLHGYIDIDNKYKLPFTKISDTHWNITFQKFHNNKIVDNSTTIHFSRKDSNKSTIIFSENPGITSLEISVIQMYRVFTEMADISLYN